MSLTNNDNLYFFNLIHNVQLRGTYTYNEILFVVKEIEKVLPLIDDKQQMTLCLDLFYKDCPNKDNLIHKITLNRMRTVFHRPLKEAGENPLT